MNVDWHPIKSEADLPPAPQTCWITIMRDEGEWDTKIARYVVEGVGDIARKALGESDG